MAQHHKDAEGSSKLRFSQAAVAAAASEATMDAVGEATADHEAAAADHEAATTIVKKAKENVR